MAKSSLGLNNHQSKAVHAIMGLLCLLMFVHKAQAREFTVGNSGWGVRTTSTESYNQWAERNRFQIGDSLVFVYSPNEDSVLQVTKEAYDNCTTDAPLAKYTDGHTIVSLNRSGPFYFISGNKDNCLKDEKLVVVVLAGRSNTSTTNATAPASPPLAASPQSPPASVPAPYGESPPTPTPAPLAASPQSPPGSVPAPAPAPYRESPPTPTPVPTEQSPASPPQAASAPLPSASILVPAPSIYSPPNAPPDISPTPAPTQQSPPPSAASSVFIGVTGSIGAFLASYLLLSF
ncbi:hypothetical protein SLE2022_017910 [Rubroshorea leprosula]